MKKTAQSKVSCILPATSFHGRNCGMSLFILYLLIERASFACAAAAAAASPMALVRPTLPHDGHQQPQPASTPTLLLEELVRFPRGGWVPGQNINKYIDRLFDSVDENHDGGVSIEELYERVLLLYVKINQQASVPPPTKATVMALFRNADTDRSRRLDRDQFRKIMKIIYSRAATRMILAKLSKVVVAPLLALNVVQICSCSGCWWEENVVTRIPTRWEFLLNANLWRSLLTVLFIISLTNVVVSMATVVLDVVCGVDNNKKEEEVDVGI